MSDLVVNVARVGFVVVLYLFLFFVARAVGRHLSAAAPPTAPPAPPANPSLRLRTGRSEPIVVEVRKPVVVGRSSEADVVIDDDFASGLHARFEVAGGTLYVEDLGSTNGTVVNGGLAPGRTALAAGDLVRIGEAIVEVR